ncbi:MAG: Holliday junction branch migration DNA helicase RuvB [Candidatus Omnitrophica bacterium 4484_213]|nr:MAG: Holliday junction branch migration DNA helicase RuvB [Candidatus Omnitrophica bacterium 4484_213]
MAKGHITPLREKGDVEYENILRPYSWKDFIGQEKLKKNLRVFIQAAKQRQECLDHILFFGPPGLGKTTLAYIVAKEMDVEIKVSSGTILERPGDLVGLLTNLEKGRVLFIDEIHRLPRIVEEYLYSAMEDYSLDIMIDKGPNARSLKLHLFAFTLIGATTRSGLLTSPLRSRFGVISRLDYYPPEDLYKIILNSSKILNISIDEEGAREIALRSRGTPRIANRLLRRIRDYAQVEGKGKISKEIVEKALEMLEVDKAGLDEMDKRILETIITKFKGGPVGINTIAVAVGEEEDTLEEIYEPYLIQEGFLQRTPQGRIATEKAYKHFKFPFLSNRQKRLI